MKLLGTPGNPGSQRIVDLFLKRNPPQQLRLRFDSSILDSTVSSTKFLVELWIDLLQVTSYGRQTGSFRLGLKGRSRSTE